MQTIVWPMNCQVQLSIHPEPLGHHGPTSLWEKSRNCWGKIDRVPNGPEVWMLVLHCICITVDNNIAYHTKDYCSVYLRKILMQ